MTNSTTNTYTVYRIITPCGQQYIGATSNFDNRMKQHQNAAKYGSHLPVHKAIRKYGLNNLRIAVIESNLTQSEAALLERVLIREFATIVPNGLNVTTGGEGSEFGGLHTGKGYDFNKQKQKYEVGRRLNGKHLYFKAFQLESDALHYSNYLKTLNAEQLLVEHKAVKVRKPKVTNISRATTSIGEIVTALFGVTVVHPTTDATRETYFDGDKEIYGKAPVVEDKPTETIFPF